MVSGTGNYYELLLLRQQMFSSIKWSSNGHKDGPKLRMSLHGLLGRTIFKIYRESKPDLYKCFIDDIIGTSPILQEQIEQFIQYIQSFHPTIEYNTT